MRELLTPTKLGRWRPLRATESALIFNLISMYLVAIAWIYVTLMMAVAEATNTNGSILGGAITFLLYGVGPTALLVYILSTPARRRTRRAREQAEAGAEAEQVNAAGNRPLSEPDTGRLPATDPVSTVRKEK